MSALLDALRLATIDELEVFEEPMRVHSESTETKVGCHPIAVRGIPIPNQYLVVYIRATGLRGTYCYALDWTRPDELGLASESAFLGEAEAKQFVLDRLRTIVARVQRGPRGPSPSHVSASLVDGGRNIRGDGKVTIEDFLDALQEATLGEMEFCEYTGFLEASPTESRGNSVEIHLASVRGLEVPNPLVAYFTRTTDGHSCRYTVVDRSYLDASGRPREEAFSDEDEAKRALIDKLKATLRYRVAASTE